jgi:multiple sugar transport system permease protein
MAWAFMLPALLSILIWQYVPLVRGSLMAFQDYFILTPSRFVWLDNFIKLFHDMDFRTSITNTATYVGLSLLIGFAVPIILAVLLSEIPVGKVFFRIIFYLPNITSGLVITLMWLDFYNGTITGMLNRLLLSAGFISSDQPVRWLQDTTTLWGLLPMICVIVPGVWAGAGGGCLIYLAALKGVPDDVYEAADLDGAGPLRKFLRITLPYMKPLVLINLVGAFIGAFHAAGNILLMTGGGPDNKTMTIGLQIFYNAYLYLRFGYATAMAWILGSALIGFTLYQLRILRDVKFAANT